MFERAWLIILGIVLIFFELLFGAIAGFDIVFLGLALVIGGVVHYFTLDWQSGVVTAISVIVVYLVFIRRIIRKKLLILTQKIGIDSLLGKKGVVVQTITAKKPGKVIVDGEIWRATAKTTLREDTEVLIFGMEGITLQVEQQENDKSK